MNKHDIEELQSFLQGEYIEESTSRSLKEVKQHQKDVEKHADITDKAGFHRLVKRKMTTSKGHENATGASGVATAKTGTIDISLTSADFKIDSPAEKLFDRVFEIVKKWDTDKTTQISTAARKELFSILGFPDNQFDIYPNRCTAKGTDVFKIVKLVLFKSVGTGKVFPSVGYRFFHASDKPDIAKTGLIPSLGSTHGFIDQKTGKPTINRSYNKKACFFMAIKNNESLIYNIIDKAFRYGDYLYEYKPKRGDVFYEDLFSRPGHTSVMKDLLNIPGVIPVFINSNTPLPVKRIDKNIENRLLDRDKKVVKDTISSSNDTMRYISAEHKKFKQQSERLIKILETVKSQIKSANTTSELYEALWEFIGVSDLRVDGCDDKCYEIIKNSDKNDNIDSIKNKIIDVITKYQENIINDNKSNRNYLYQQRYKPLKRYIDNQRQEIQDIDRKLKSHKNHPAFESYNDENVDDDYITEATSKSLKEVKQHQKDVSSNKDAGDITRVRKVLKSKLENDTTNNRYGRYDGKRDVYDKTPAIRDKIRIHLFMKKSECKNSDELYAFNYADKVLSGSNKTEVKNKMCRLVGFNPKVYGMDLYEHQPGEYFDINFIENATKQRQIYPTEINKYRYFHFSKTGNLHNVGLSSSRISRHANGGLIYPSKCIFFYAVEKTADLDNVLARMINGDPRGVRTAFFYGDYVYEYIPKKSDKIYIDSTDDSNLLQLQQKTRNHGFFKVFLNLDGEGRSSVPVKEFNFNISYNKQNIMNQEETKLRSYTARLEDIYDWNPKQADKVVDIFSKYIHDHEANSNSPKPRKELDASLKSLADFYRSAVDKFIDEEKIPQEERRLFKKNAYGHFHKILKTKLNKRFEYGSNDYKTLTKYFHESYNDENVDGDYITEATSKSLKEVKQHQQTLKTSEDKQKFGEIQKYARNFLKNDLDDTLVFQPRVRNKDDNQKYEYIVNLIKKIKNNSSDRKSKDELFKILGIGKNKVEIRNINLDGTVYVSLYVLKGYQKLGLKSNMFFIHTTNAKLNPPNTLIPKEANAARGQYSSKQCYFYCVIANNINEAVQKKLVNQPLYGYHFYQYIPNKSDEIFLDSFHMHKSEMINRNKDVFPVFITTDKPLHVKDITNLVIKKESSKDLEDKLYEYGELVDELHELEGKYSPLMRKHVPKSKNVIENEKEIEKVQNKIKEFEKKYGFTRTMVESYNDENVDDDYITEANEESKKARKNAQEFMRNEYGTSHPTSMTSKQRNRMKRWLKDNDYDPKTGTIATDIIDKKTGKPVRVNVGTNAYALSPDILGHPAQAFAMPNKEEYRKYFSDTLLRDGRGYINMPLSEMKRHPSVSNGISKHEEGHIADMQYGEKMVGKRNGRRKLKKLNIKDYGPHINQDELAADVYSVQHNKYKDKLGFIKRLSSSDIRARKGLRHDLYKVYKSFYDGNLKDVDMTDINKLKTILKDMIKDSETELKDLKQFEKLNDNDAFRANVTGVENGIKSYKRLLGKIENITPDEFKGEFKQAVFNSYKPYFVEVLKVFDKESEFRADFAKRYIKEFAIENDMSTIEVIQEMYLQDMEDYVFQEDSESIESYIDETIERFNAFMEEFNNGQIGDSEFIMESARDDKYAKITKDYIKKSGRLSFRYNRNEDDDLPQEVVDRIIDLCNKLLEFPANGSYNQYKTYYDTLCKIVHHPNTTNISRMVLDHAVNDGYINFGMNVGGKSLQHRCHLKPGTRLYHTSENGNLSILKPNVFIGDDVFYAEPRTYFYCEAIGGRMGAPSKPVEYDANNKPIITDEMKRRFKHVYMYTVKPGDHVYFDNELRGDSIICSAVYLTYTKPIKLTKIY